MEKLKVQVASRKDNLKINLVGHFLAMVEDPSIDLLPMEVLAYPPSAKSNYRIRFQQRT